MKKRGTSDSIGKYYLHFNAIALFDITKAYEVQLEKGCKTLVSLAGTMNTAKLGEILDDEIDQRNGRF